MTTDRRDMSDSPVPGTGRLPLEGLRILDVTVVWAGPYGTMHLADWGAEVIRLESIRHFATSTRGQMARPPIEMVRLRNTGMGYADDDPGERPWNRQAIFNTHGRNKLSVTMDLTAPEGQETLERLVASADGFLENNVTISMERMGITWERLSAINPRLIMVRMPAFGNEGPYKNYRTWGNHMEALAGHPLLRAYPDEDASRWAQRRAERCRGRHWRRAGLCHGTAASQQDGQGNPHRGPDRREFRSVPRRFRHGLHHERDASIRSSATATRSSRPTTSISAQEMSDG